MNAPRVQYNGKCMECERSFPNIAFLTRLGARSSMGERDRQVEK